MVVTIVRKNSSTSTSAVMESNMLHRSGWGHSGVARWYSGWSLSPRSICRRMRCSCFSLLKRRLKSRAIEGKSNGRVVETWLAASCTDRAEYQKINGQVPSNSVFSCSVQYSPEFFEVLDDRASMLNFLVLQRLHERRNRFEAVIGREPLFGWCLNWVLPQIQALSTSKVGQLLKRGTEELHQSLN